MSCVFFLIYEVLQISVAAPAEENGYVEVIIGVLTAVMLLLLGVFVIILVLSRRQKHQGSPTTILRNHFGVTINMKVGVLNVKHDILQL